MRTQLLIFLIIIIIITSIENQIKSFNNIHQVECQGNIHGKWKNLR